MTKILRIKLFIITITCVDLCVSDWVSLGHAHSFVCQTTNRNVSNIVWQVDGHSIFQCQYFEKISYCDPAYDNLFELYEVNITSDALAVKSTLTIKSVVISQHNSTWYCRTISIFDTGTLVFNLSIFVPPETPYCLNATLLDDINIKIQCITEKVFPDASCLFYINTNNTGAVESKTVLVESYSEPSKSAGYIRTECTYTILADVMGPGSHVFYSVMYPNIKSTITEEMKTSSQFTNPLILGYPNAALAPDCQVNDYIKENQNRTCTCYDSSPTVLPTHVTWLNGAMQDGRLVFFSKRPTTDNATFTCSISNKLSWTKEITYQPKIAYGPDNSALTLLDLTIDQCDSNGANISGTCTISDSDPDPTVYIYASNALVKSQLKITKREYRFSQIISGSGIVIILCRAVNPVFEELTSEIINFVTVKGPPSTPQISTFTQNKTNPTNGNQLLVKEGNTYIVCESKGGYPLYKNLTLVCGTNRKTNENSDIISITLNVSRDMEGMNCTCVVGHESKCVHNFFTVSLKLSRDEQNNVGAIIGGIITAVVGIVLIVLLVVFIIRRHTRKLKRPSNAATISKIQTYSNVRESEVYINSGTHQYERPCFTNDLPSQADVHTPADFGRPNLNSDISECFLGGFIVQDEHINKQQFPTENSDITFDKIQDGDIDVKQEEHHYEDIDDVNEMSRDVINNRTETTSEPEQIISYVNI